MAAPGDERRGVGLRKIRLYALDADGDIDSSTTTVYEGVEVVGAQELTINDPEPQKITHFGDDVVLQVDMLPSGDALDGAFTVSGRDDNIDELVGGRISRTIGNMRVMSMKTDEDGELDQVGAVIYEQSLDADGDRVWEAYIFPKCTIYPIVNGMNADPDVSQFRLYPQYSSKHLWGESLSSGTDGGSRAQVQRIIMNYRPLFVKFDGDNSTTEFTFDSDRPAQSTDDINVWVDGILQTADFTAATTGVTFTTAPTTDANIVVGYGY